MFRENAVNRDTFNSQTAVDRYTQKVQMFPEEIILFKQIQTGSKVLDLGCGTGRTTRYLKDERGANVVGVDVAPNMVKRATELHPDIEFRVADARSLPYENGYFDHVVFSFNGIDYIYPKEERLRALKEINRVLKSLGHFIFSFHNENWLKKFTLRKLLKIRPYREGYVIEKTSMGDLITAYTHPLMMKNTLQDRGFNIIYTYGERNSSWVYMMVQKAK